MFHRPALLRSILTLSAGMRWLSTDSHAIAESITDNMRIYLSIFILLGVFVNDWTSFQKIVDGAVVFVEAERL